MLTINLNEIFTVIVSYLSNPYISFILLFLLAVPCLLLYVKIFYSLNQFWLKLIFRDFFKKAQDEELLDCMALALTIGFTIFFSFKVISILTYAHIL